MIKKKTIIIKPTSQISNPILPIIKKVVIENAQKLSNLRNININPAFCISLFLLTCGLMNEFLYIYSQLCQSS